MCVLFCIHMHNSWDICHRKDIANDFFWCVLAYFDCHFSTLDVTISMKLSYLSVFFCNNIKQATLQLSRLWLHFFFGHNQQNFFYLRFVYDLDLDSCYCPWTYIVCPHRIVCLVQNMPCLVTVGSPKQYLFDKENCLISHL